MDKSSGEGGTVVREGPLAVLARPLVVVGGLIVLVVAAMITVSVFMRWLINWSVPGDIELVQIGTALAVFAFLPLCQSRRGNIRVDTFTLRLPRRVQDALDALWDLVYAGIALVVAWRLGVGAWDTSNTVSMMLGLPSAAPATSISPA